MFNHNVMGSRYTVYDCLHYIPCLGEFFPSGEIGDAAALLILTG